MQFHGAPFVGVVEQLLQEGEAIHLQAAFVYGEVFFGVLEFHQVVVLVATQLRRPELPLMIFCLQEGKKTEYCIMVMLNGTGIVFSVQIDAD